MADEKLELHRSLWKKAAEQGWQIKVTLADGSSHTGKPGAVSGDFQKVTLDVGGSPLELDGPSIQDLEPMPD